MLVATKGCMCFRSPVIILSLLLAVALAAVSIASPSPLERAREFVAGNKPDEALEALSTYHPSQQELFAYHYAFAQALVQAGRRYESIEHFRLASLYAGSEKEREQMLFQRGEVYGAMNYDTEAAVCFDVFLKKFPNSALAEQAELGIADARYRLGEYREALAHYEKSASLRASYGKANSLQALGRTAEAHELYRTLLEKDPQAINSSPETLYNLAENYRETGRLNDAQIYFNSVKDSPWLEKAQIGLGTIAVAENRLESAAKYFTAAAASSERSVRRQAILSLAEVNLRQGRTDDAERALVEIRKTLPYGSQYDAAALLLARLYKARGRYHDSISLLKELIFRRTPSAAALDELEAILLDAKDRNHDEFVRLWNEAGRWLLEPSRSTTLLTIARGLRHAGRPFIDVCSWLIKYGPEDAKAEARLLLSDFYASLGDAATAAGYMQRAKVKAGSDEGLRVKARVSLANNDVESAAAALMAINRVRVDDTLLLLDIAPRLADNEKALDFCDKAFQQAPGSAETYVRYGDLLAAAGRKGDALRYYQAAVAAPPAAGAKPSADVEWAHYRIAALGAGNESVNALKSIETAKGTLGRLASAGLKEAAIRGKVKNE